MRRQLIHQQHDEISQPNKSKPRKSGYALSSSEIFPKNNMKRKPTLSSELVHEIVNSLWVLYKSFALAKL